METALAEPSGIAAPVALPPDDLNDFYALPVSERDRVVAILSIFTELAHASKLVEACKRVSRRMRHKGRGYGANNLYRLYQEYRRAGRDWRVIVRDYKAPSAGLPHEFLRFWIGLTGDSGRDDAGKAAYDTLLHQYWFADKPVPGYGRITEWWPKHRPNQPMPRGIMDEDTGVPQGWSYGNLMRKIPKRKAIKTLMKRGHHAAHGELMQLLRDRSQLMPLELITFDDVRLDLQALFDINGKLQICYVNAVFALDVGTGKVIGWGTKPRFKKDDDKNLGIERADVRFLLLDILSRGMPPYRMNVLLENAAAALTVEDRKAFDAAFPDRLQIETTGIARRTLLSSGFTEEGGMPWQKGWIEAYFRLLQTHLSMAPGSTGNRYDNDRGDLQGRLKYAKSLIRFAEQHPEKAGEIIWPVFTEEKLSVFLSELVERLNWRTDHHLQGFDSVHLFRLNPPQSQISNLQSQISPWRPMAELYRLSPDQRMDPAIEIRRRPESPAERERRLLQGIEFEPVHPGALYALASEKVKVRVRRSEVRLSGKIADGDPLIFRQCASTSTEILGEEHEGREYSGFLSADKHTLHLFTPAPDLAYVASLARQNRIDLRDQDAIERASGEVHRSRQAIAGEAAGYQERANMEHANMRAHNANLVPTAEPASSRFSESGSQMQAAEANAAKQTRSNATTKKKSFAAQAAYARRLREQAEL